MRRLPKVIEEITGVDTSVRSVQVIPDTGYIW